MPLGAGKASRELDEEGMVKDPIARGRAKETEKKEEVGTPEGVKDKVKSLGRALERNGER